MKKAIAILSFVLTLAVGATAQKQTPAQHQHDLYRQATDLYQKQKYAAAQEIYDRIANGQSARTDQTTADAHYFAAVCSEKLDNDDAFFRLEEFLRLYPQSGRCNMARFYLGNFYYTRADYGRALTYYRAVDAKEVEYNHRSEYNFKMGYCLFQLGDYAKASQLFAQQIGGQSKYQASSLYYYAHIQYVNGQYELALKNFKELEKDRKFAKIVPSYLARIYYYLGREEELLEMAPRLINDKNTFKREEIYQMIGETYFNRGQYAQAIEQYRMVETHSDAQGKTCTPHDNDYQMGYSYYMLHQYDSAARYLERKTNCDDLVAQNATYTLADCYIHLGKNYDARSMFLQASKVGINNKIKEDALFNYAKLSCELNQNAYNESIKLIQQYLSKYPKSSHRTEAQEILTDLYSTTSNYKDAIAMLENIPNRNAKLEQAYQRAVFNRGIELTNSGKQQEGVEMFEKAVKINAIPQTTAEASYLLAEAQYASGKYNLSEKNINKFLLSSFSNSSVYAEPARYTYGYLLMRRGKYDEAQETFEDLAKRLGRKSDEANNAMLNDTYNRLGDCLYVQSHFQQSIEQYNKVISANAKDADYATLQKALAYGAMGQNSEKLTYLNYIFERFDNSPLKSKAMLEIANTYMACDNNEMALTYYTSFIKQYPHSSYVKSALLNVGLIYYNTDRYDQALKTYDRLLTDYPGTGEARDALATIKNIYIEQNRVDDYFTYVKSATKMNVSAVEQDSTTFLSVENRYQQGDYENAAAGFEGYLSKFPNGLFAVKAHYLLADCYFRQGQNSQALPHYLSVVQSGNNQYAERSLYNAANIAYNAGNYAQAATLYQRLSANAESDKSLLQGKIGSLRCAASLGQHASVIQAGRMVINEPKATSDLKEEAYLTMARSCFNNNLRDSANAYYTHLTTSANGEYNGEARCRMAEIVMLQQDYAKAEKMIESIVADATNDYWLAYAFILWADIYYARGNNMQAKQTLQSIIDNYDGAELVAVAQAKRNAIIEAEQQPTNDPETELTIEL